MSFDWAARKDMARLTVVKVRHFGHARLAARVEARVEAGGPAQMTPAVRILRRISDACRSGGFSMSISASHLAKPRVTA